MTERAVSIGTLGEKPLHASLKQWYSEPGDRVEVPVETFVIDLVRGDLLIEIQTRSFSSMKKKLRSLLDLGHRVRIVHPIPIEKWLVKIDDGGTILDRRRSPKRGVTTDLFSEMVSFPDLLAHPGLEIDVLLTREEELRRHTPDKAWRRKGWVVVERSLLEVVESRRIDNTADLVGLLPRDIPVEFTTADLAAGLGRPRRSAQQMAYCLAKTGVIAPTGKQGNAVTYQIETG